MPNVIYELNVFDFDRAMPRAAVASGGRVIVCLSGRPKKATLLNADTGASLSQATGLAFSRGKLRFATDDTVDTVDIYGFAPTGHFIAMRGVKPGAEAEIPIETLRYTQMAYIPFSFGDYTAATETDTGLDMPAGSVVLPGAHVRVTAADSGITLEAGLLSSESGGDADGFIDAVSLASAVTVAPTLTSTPTLGALLRTLGGTTPDVALPRPYPITTAVSLSITPSSGWDTGEGFICLPYALQPV